MNNSPNSNNDPQEIDNSNPSGRSSTSNSIEEGDFEIDGTSYTDIFEEYTPIELLQFGYARRTGEINAKYRKDIEVVGSFSSDGLILIAGNKYDLAMDRLSFVPIDAKTEDSSLTPEINLTDLNVSAGDLDIRGIDPKVYVLEVEKKEILKDTAIFMVDNGKTLAKNISPIKNFIEDRKSFIERLCNDTESIDVSEDFYQGELNEGEITLAFQTKFNGSSKKGLFYVNGDLKDIEVVFSISERGLISIFSHRKDLVDIQLNIAAEPEYRSDDSIPTREGEGEIIIYKDQYETENTYGISVVKNIFLEGNVILFVANQYGCYYEQHNAIEFMNEKDEYIRLAINKIEEPNPELRSSATPLLEGTAGSSPGESPTRLGAARSRSASRGGPTER